MPISIEQRSTLYQLARDHWLEAQCTILAYEREFQSSRNVSKWMKRGTLLSASVTAVSAGSQIPLLTTIAGLITAMLSGIEQAYSPAKSSQELWECRMQLDGIKRDLVVCAIAIENATDMAAGMDPINQIAGRLANVIKIPVQVLEADREVARAAFKGSVLAELISRHEADHDYDEEAPAALGFDAPDIVAVARPRAAS